MIAIIDYGVGNLASIKNAFDSLNIESIITSDKSIILNSDKVILPGVGAFKDAIDLFRSKGFDDTIDQCIKLKKPILGICVGMQMLFQYSNEFGRHKGLSYFEGEFVKFDDSIYKVPHMGWNNIIIKNGCPLFNNISNPYVYFVHSYYLKDSKYSVAKCNYAGEDFCAAIWKDNIYATQFHPEKSGDVGLKILKNFGDL